MTSVPYRSLRRVHWPATVLVAATFTIACAGDAPRGEPERVPPVVDAVSPPRPAADAKEPRPPLPERVEPPQVPVDLPEAPADMPRRLRDHCPFELGCHFGEWLIVDEVPVYARFDDRSSQMGVLGPDECVETVRADMVVDEAGLVVMKQASRPFEAGDTIWVLSYAGEGSFIVWSRGRIWDVLGDWPQDVGESDRARTLRLQATTWWIELASTPPAWIALRHGEGYPFDYDVEMRDLAQGIEPCGPK